MLRVAKMSTLSTKFQPPVNRTMTVLDPSFFQKKVPLVVCHFPNPANISQFAKLFKTEILRVPKIPHVIKLEDVPVEAETTVDAEGKKIKKIRNDNHMKKGVLLREDIECVADAESKLLPDALKFIMDTHAEMTDYSYELNYDFWSADDILKNILPAGDDLPSGFTMTGHIAHVNLKNEYKPFDKLIGQVILDKNPNIRTVVDKVDSIATKFRTFQMKVLAGDEDMEVVQRESNCNFKFDFSKVYWNSRLHTEHDRLCQKFAPGSVVGDVFAGVGPFAVPAGKKQVIVMSNDLNPESFKYMQMNVKENGVSQFVEPMNLDGREFIEKSAEILLDYVRNHDGKVVVKGKKPRKGPIPADVVYDIPQYYSHYVMNLPDSALTFLDAFIGLYSRNKNVYETLSAVPELPMPWVHVHCFEKYEHDETPTMEELHDRVYAKIADLIKHDLPKDKMEFHLVRRVAPTKPMFCVSFQLPREVAFAPQQ